MGSSIPLTWEATVFEREIHTLLLLTMRVFLVRGKES